MARHFEVVQRDRWPDLGPVRPILDEYADRAAYPARIAELLGERLGARENTSFVLMPVIAEAEAFTAKFLRKNRLVPI